MNKLSHSSLTLFQTCPKAYFYRYIKKYYTETKSGALCFGTALDKAVECLLKERDLEKANEEFLKTWTEQEINKIVVPISKSINIVYANSDYDADLIQDWTLIEMYADELKLKYDDGIQDLINRIYKQKEITGYDGLPNERKRLLNYSNWLSLSTKGYLMLNAFNENILPQIEEVLGTQVEINLENDDGDKIIGFADMVVRWKGITEPVIFDLKTATREYESDSVLTSPQLTLYTNALSAIYNTRRAGFLVLHKTIKKNKKKICSVCGHDGTGTNFKTCNNELPVEGKKPKRCDGKWNVTMDPKASYQILINEIPQRMEELVIENMVDINEQIKHGIFTRNFESCEKAYGPCSYRKICHECSMDGIIETQEV